MRRAKPRHLRPQPRGPRWDAAGIRRGLRGLGTVARLYLAAGHGATVLLLALTVLGAGVPAGTSALTKAVVDAAALGEFALWAAIGLAGMGMLAAGVPAGSEYLQQQLNRRVNEHCMSRLYTAINRFEGISRFESPAYLDRIRLAEGAASPSVNATVMGSFGFVRSAIALMSLVGVVMLINQFLAVLMLVAGLPGLVAETTLSKERVKLLDQLASTDRRREFFTSVLTDVQAAKEIRVFGLGRLLHDRMLRQVRWAHERERSLDQRVLRTQLSLEALGATVAGAGLIWAASRASSGVLSLGDMSAFLLAVVGTQGALRGMIDGFVQAREAVMLYERYAAVAGDDSDLVIPPALETCRPLQSAVELRDVWFRYSNDAPWVLRGLSLSLASGETTALVGANGAGKSTLVKLLCRFYDPTHGAILWDGVDIRQMPIDDLRRRISVVFQDYVSWDLTARENITLGDVERLEDHDAAVQAARVAGLDPVLSRLPEGYDTVLGRVFGAEALVDSPDHGSQLSGGQWQRLAIARAIFRQDRGLLILDEPSAFLDAGAEHDLRECLRTQWRASAKLLVSHRLSTVHRADTVVVLDQGAVAEIGSPTDLLSTAGPYARLFRLSQQCELTGARLNGHEPHDRDARR